MAAGDQDETGGERKPGFFSRLFGRGRDEAPHPAEPAPTTAPEPEAPAAEQSAPAGSEGGQASEEPPQAEAPAVPEKPELAPSPAAEVAEPRAEPEEEPQPEAGPEPAQSVAAAALASSAAAEPSADAPTPRSWWQRLRQGLSRSSSSIGRGIADVFTKKRLDAAMLDDLEDILIQADLGVSAASRIREAVASGRFDRDIDPAEVKEVLAHEVEKTLAPVALPLAIDVAKKPFVILVVGVNGSGKTTTIGKLAAKLVASGHKVLLAAGDTFRAAAIEQLQIWGGRIGAPVVARAQGADAAGLGFDAVRQAREEGYDVVLMDTAGRLQNRTELMAELEKVVRVMKKVDAEAPHAVLLVLDATVGQNAMNQVEIFGRVAGVTGLVMTKLDGTARGGILVAIAERFGLPVHYIGVGEGVDDLEPFAAGDFARAIAGIDNETAGR